MKIIVRDIDSTEEWLLYNGTIGEAEVAKAVIQKEGFYDSQNSIHHNYYGCQITGKNTDTIFEIIVTPEDWKE